MPRLCPRKGQVMIRTNWCELLMSSGSCDRKVCVKEEGGGHKVPQELAPPLGDEAAIVIRPFWAS